MKFLLDFFPKKSRVQGRALPQPAQGQGSRGQRPLVQGRKAGSAIKEEWYARRNKMANLTPNKDVADFALPKGSVIQKLAYVLAFK